MAVRIRDVGLIDPVSGEGPTAALVSGKCGGETARILPLGDGVHKRRIRPYWQAGSADPTSEEC